MSVVYHKWFDIEIKHEYFTQGICKNVTIIPFLETATLWSKHQVLVRQEKNITSLYVGVNEAETDTIEDGLKQIGALYFWLINEDPLFYNYTEVRPSKVDQILLFKHTVGDSTLHQSDTVTNDDEVNWKQFAEQLPISERRRRENCIGIIKIESTSIGPLQAETPMYSIQFSARSVHAIYKVVVDSRPEKLISIDKVEFIQPNAPRFSGPVEVEIANSVIAQVFTSVQSIILQEQFELQPVLWFTYQESHSNAAAIPEKMSLPHPNTESLESFIDADGNVKSGVSTIVYV